MAIKMDEVVAKKTETVLAHGNNSAAHAPSAEISIALHGRELVPKQPIPLDVSWVEEVRVNTSAVERRAATLPTRRTVKKAWQAAWLVKAIQCMDLTTLNSDDTDGRVRRLCAKAMRPLTDELLAGLGLADRTITVGAVCVYHRFVASAKAALAGSGIPVAAVSTAFPAGLAPFETRLAEIAASVAAGAEEIDIVITREHVLTANWPALYDEVAAFKAACGPAHMKTILGTGDLRTFRNVGRASMVAMMAGSDFIKTSTGKEGVNATIPVALVMARAIRAYRDMTGHRRRLQAGRRHAPRPRTSGTSSS